MNKHPLILEPSGQRIQVTEKTSYLEAIRQSGQYISTECGGKGTCGKCKIIIKPSPKISENEREYLKSEEIELGVRLACEHAIASLSRVVLFSGPVDSRILTEAVLDNVEISIDKSIQGQYGLAVDIGTTTIVAYLMDLGSGEQIASSSTLNPQISYGEDIVTRITAALENESNQVALKLQLIESIEELERQMLDEIGVKEDVITRISVVGNTAMHHFFLGLDTSPLSVAPYSPLSTEAVVMKTNQLGFKKTNAEIYMGPLIAGFVGSDITALVLSQRLDQSDEVVLGIDIGTNGEIVLSKKGELFSTSTAAGSAFEGATISRGMRGQIGAIEHITISGVNDAPDITVIGHEIPRGLCGSGIVDVVSELRRMNLVTPQGLLLESKRVIKDTEAGLGYIVVNIQEHDCDERILFTQKDIRQVQSAKAAIMAGIEILMRNAEIDVDSLDRVLLAGAFGNYIRPEAALRIGLIPEVSLARIQQIGNTAGQGAKMMLLSSVERREAEKIPKRVKHVSLAGNKDFQSLFIDNTLFPDFLFKN
ncbi:MAG: ASKHA domain-containing protein [Candidatus Thorarchaeota archaeon]